MAAASDKGAHRLWVKKVLPWLGLLPYLILAGVIFALANVSLKNLSRFWWLAPVAAGLFILVALLVLGTQVFQQRKDQRRAAALGQLNTELLSLLNAPAGEQHKLLRLIPHLSSVSCLNDIRQASNNFSAAEKQCLRNVLLSAGIATHLEEQARHPKPKREAIVLLGWIEDEAALGILEEIFQNADEDRAYLAGQSLAAYKSPEAY